MIHPNVLKEGVVRLRTGYSGYAWASVLNAW